MPEILFDYPLTKLGFPDDASRQRVDAAYGKTVFEHLSRTRSLRDLHYALTRCALLTSRDTLKPVLILEKPLISHDRIRSIISQFLDLIRSERAKNLHVVATDQQGKIHSYLGELTKEEEEQIPAIILHSRARLQSRRRRGFSPFDVLRVLSIHWLRNTGPITLKQLGLESGLSYPSVAKALEKYHDLIEQQSDRSVQLSEFPMTQWMETVLTAPKARLTQGYHVPAGKSRSSDSLLSRLSENKDLDFALGGIHAARHYYPGIDLVGSPRLDITLHLAQPADVNRIVRQIDPALRPVETGSLPQVVIHHLDRPEPFFNKRKDGLMVTDEVDCLLDLHEARLEPQAAEFLDHLTKNVNS